MYQATSLVKMVNCNWNSKSSKQLKMAIHGKKIINPKNPKSNKYFIKLANLTIFTRERSSKGLLFTLLLLFFFFLFLLG
jgi:hypothetical protein